MEAQSKYLNKSSGDKKLGEGPKRTPFHILMCYSYPFDSILTFFEIYIMKTILKRLDLKFKVALGVCFALKSWKEYLLLFTYLITLSKDVTLPLITKFKTNRPLSNLFVNRILN